MAMQLSNNLRIIFPPPPHEFNGIQLQFKKEKTEEK